MGRGQAHRILLCPIHDSHQDLQRGYGRRSRAVRRHPPQRCLCTLLRQGRGPRGRQRNSAPLRRDHSPAHPHRGGMEKLDDRRLCSHQRGCQEDQPQESFHRGQVSPTERTPRHPSQSARAGRHGAVRPIHQRLLGQPCTGSAHTEHLRCRTRRLRAELLGHRPGTPAYGQGYRDGREQPIGLGRQHLRPCGLAHPTEILRPPQRPAREADILQQAPPHHTGPGQEPRRVRHGSGRESRCLYLVGRSLRRHSAIRANKPF